jgi:hypothetical protein
VRGEYAWNIDSELGNQQAGFMKTTLDLPQELVKEVKLRALNENRKLKDAMAELLRRGLAAPEAGQPGAMSSALKKDRKTGLPLIECRKAAVREISPKRTAEILLEQEVKWHEEAGR